MSIGLIDGDVLLHWTAWGTTNLQGAKDNWWKTLNSWVEAPFCTDYLVCLGPYDGKNFRDDLWPEYKQTATRVSGRGKRLDHFQEFKDWIYKGDNTVVADNIEADDLLGIYSSQANSVIISVDKDLKQLEGFHYNPRAEIKLFYQDRDASLLFLLEQLVKGDPMDKIPGVPSYGDKKAKLLIDSTGGDVKAAAIKVVELYQEVYKDKSESALLFNGKLLYLMRQDYDWFTLEKFENMFEVEIDRTKSSASTDGEKIDLGELLDNTVT